MSWDDRTRHVRVGVAILVHRDGKLLFHLRKGPHGPGTWSFPGGNMEYSEEPIESAQRELLEETGPDARYSELQVYQPCPYVNTMFPGGKQYITLYFTCALIGGAPRVMEPDKCERWDWFAPSALPKPLFDPLENKRLRLTEWTP